MGFSKHNSMIGVVIVYVIFYFNGIVASDKELSCLDALKQDGFDKPSGFQNLASKVAKLSVKDENFEFHVPLKYITMVEQKIKQFYSSGEKLNPYGTNYVIHLISLVKRPERMLPPETWCEIDDCSTLNMFPLSETEYNNYIMDASRAISKYNKHFYSCTINVCYDKIVTPVNVQDDKNDKKPKEDNLISYNLGITGFPMMYNDYYTSKKKRFFRREPLTWCVIQACYSLLLQQGFDDVPAKKNGELVAKISVAENHNSHAYRFFKFINTSKTTAMPFDINLFYEYPLNWCAVEVCHNDLVRAGFVFDTFEESYNYLPKIKHSLEKSIGKRIVQIADYITYILFGQKIENYINEYINEYIGTIIGEFFGKFIRNTILSFMNSYIGDFVGIKVKQYIIKKCDNEEPGKYLQYLFEKILMMDEKNRFYQSEFVPKYCSHLEKLIFVTKESEEDKEYYIPADRMQRNPLEWCMVTVVHSDL